MKILVDNRVIKEPLLVSILALVAFLFFGFTHSYTQAYDRHREKLGRQWFASGNADLASGRPADAIQSFRTALVYAPAPWEYHMRLAEALSAANRTQEALGYYQALWQNHPSNGPLNLQLAQLAMRMGNTEDAERYLNGAIFGDWPKNALQNRREALFKIIDFYLKTKNISQAESQLLILSSNLSEDPTDHQRVADLFLKAGDPERAFEQYREAMKYGEESASTLAKAGDAAFRLGRYDLAESYLYRALRKEPEQSQAAQLLDTTRLILNANPYEKGLTPSLRMNRVVHDFSQAATRLKECEARLQSESTSSSPKANLDDLLQEWKRLSLEMTAADFARDPSLIDTAMTFVSEVEQQTQTLCGPPSGLDLALLTLTSQHTGEGK